MMRCFLYLRLGRKVSIRQPDVLILQVASESVHQIALVHANIKMVSAPDVRSSSLLTFKLILTSPGTG